MLAQLTVFPALPKTLKTAHLLVIFPRGKTLRKDMPHADLLRAVLDRRDMKVAELSKTPVAANAADGSLIALDDAGF